MSETVGRVSTRTRVQRFTATAMLVTACILLSIAALLALASLGADVAVTWGTQIGGGIWSIVLMSFPIVGWLIARRDPRNVIGWLLMWVGLAAGLDFASAVYASSAMEPGSTWPFGPQFANIGNWGWIAWIAVVGVFITHLFPTGRPLSRRWHRWLVFLFAMLVMGALGSALAPGGLDVDPRIENPFGVDSPVVAFLSVGVLAMPIGVCSGAASMVLRYRRAGESERLQLRWFVTAVVFVAMAFAVVMISSVSAGEGPRPLWLGIFQDIVNASWAAIPVAVGVAIFRYRLYAIDVVINRALVYLTITVLLGAVYLGTVVLFQTALQPLTGGGDIAVAGSTLVVAALFRPVRRRVQALVDRRFYRTRYDARALLEGFTARLRKQIDLDGVVTEMDATVRRAVHPSSASVWILPRPTQRS